MNTSIFLSYGRGDGEEFVQKLHADLIHLGYEAWYDRQNMTNDGAPFTQAIGDAIRNCTHFLFIVGNSSVNSQWCLGELDQALRHCKVIIPILRLGDYILIPKPIDKFHAVDFRSDDTYSDRLAELTRLITDPIRPLANIPHVPRLPDALLPRQPYVEQLKKAIRSGDPLHLVTSHQEVAVLVGVGGIGKTTLASLLCHDCEVRRTFDQILWANVGPELTKKDVPNLMRRLVDGDPSAYDDYETARSNFGEALIGHKTLIVLDDIWATDIAPAFLFSDVDCRIVVTTRKRQVLYAIGVQTSEVAVDKLADEDATHLLIQLAGRDITPMPAILGQFGGHTLAINLAGRWLRNHPNKTGNDLLRRLDKSGFGLLTIDQENKNLNLELALKLSYEDLSDENKMYFRALGIFASTGTVTLSAIATLWQFDDEDDAEDALDVLLGAGLITDRDGRYDQHPLLQTYARALATQQAEIDALEKRHFSHYHTLYSDYETNKDVTRYDAITADFPNIQNALAYARVHEQATFCDWVHALDYYLSMHSTYEIRHNLNAQALDMAKSLGDEHNQAHALRALGDVAFLRDDNDGATAQYHHAVTLYTSVDDKYGQAEVYVGLGNIASWLDDYDVAEHHFNQALRLYDACNDQQGRANVFVFLGDIACMRDDYQSMKKFNLDAGVIYAEINDKRGQADVLLGLAMASRWLDEYTQAFDYYEQAEMIYTQIEDVMGCANVYLYRGHLKWLLGEYDEAVAHNQRAGELFLSIEMKTGHAYSLIGLADVALKRGQYDEAKTYYDQIYPYYQELEDKWGCINVLLGLGEIAIVKGHYEEAKTNFIEAKALSIEIGSKVGHADALFKLGDVNRLCKSYDQAQTDYQEACAIYLSFGSLSGQLKALDGLVLLAQVQGDIPQAKKYYERYFTLAESHPFYREHPHTAHMRHAYDGL